MAKLKDTWKQVPDKPRRVLTFIVGMLLILTSVLIGWIPGPGGMVPFLLGIAVLATEFTWAEKLRDYVLDTTKRIGKKMRAHPVISTLIVALCIAAASGVAYVLYTKIL